MIEKKKKGAIGVVNLATYTSPKVVEVRNQEWVSYGDDNNYFGYLQDRINGSPTNNAIVNGISQMIFGKGLDATNKEENPTDYAQALLLFDNDTIERLCYDLKAMGQCALQVVYSIDRSRILECNHFPIEKLRSGKCNDEGEVEFYYYADDWTKVTRSKPPLAIPAFGTTNEKEEILFIKPYKTGFYYYSPVDYQGCLQYCEIEQEISNFHLNNIMQGLAPSMLVNFLNGVPTEEQQREIEHKFNNKFAGSSNAGRVILNFADSAQNASTITPVQLSDAHLQYQFLSDECMRKIMVGHRIISPMLLGIKDNTGFGNNADELKTATILMENTVIRPFQNLIIESLNKVLAYNELTLELTFKTLQPLTNENELTSAQEENEIVTKIKELPEQLLQKAIASLTNDEIRSIIGLNPSLQPQELKAQEPTFNVESFDGEVVSDEWELVDVREYSKDNIEIEAWAKIHISEKKGTKLKNEIIKSYPNKESYLDKDIYKVRYAYSQRYNKVNSRDFCVKMMARTANGVVYRKEDIDMASFQGVNNELGHKGQNYSLFEFKGGVNCSHYFSENLYRLKSKTDGTPYVDKALSSSEQVENIPGYNPNPRGSENSKIAPIDMPNQGHHPNYLK